MQTRNIFVCMAFFLLFSCFSACKKHENEKEAVQYDGQGVIIALSHLWRSSISNDGTLAYGVTTSVVFNGTVLCAGGEKGTKPLGNQFLLMKDAETGKDLWRWDEKLTTFEAIDIDQPHQYDNYLVLQQGPRNYCIDIATGKSLSKNSFHHDFGADVSGIGERYFITGNPINILGLLPTDFQEDAVYEGNVKTSSVREIIKIPYSREFIRQTPSRRFVGLVRTEPFLHQSDTMLAVLRVEPVNPSGNNTYLGVYNLSKRQWVHSGEKIFVQDGGGGSLKIQNDKVYQTSAKSFLCRDLWTGKKIWDIPFDGDFSFSGFILEENRIIANCEDTYMYALDLETGRTLWKEKTNGTGSRLVYLDGVVYLVAGGVLHAVEAATGKHLWRLKSPDLAVNQGAFFFGFVAAVPGKNGKKGRIVASTGLNAYCYEAAR